MLLDIYATVLDAKDGGVYVVVASAFPRDASESIMKLPHMTGSAKSIEEAQALRQRLAETVRKSAEEQGHHVGRVNFR